MSDIEYSVLEAQQNIHELIAQQHPLEQTLDAIADWVGSMMPGALVSIMQFHPASNSLSLIPSDRFSDRFFRIWVDFKAQEAPLEAPKTILKGINQLIIFFSFAERSQN